jgi:HlyD family secretion protein
MKIRKPVIVAAIVVVAAAAAAYAYFFRGARNESNVLRLSGNIEVTDADVSFKIPGRVAERLVDEGDFVQKDATIATLERADVLAELAASHAELHAAQAAAAELEAGSRPQDIAAAAAVADKARAFLAELLAGSRPQEIAVGEATLARAQADLLDAQTNYLRVKNLFDREVAAKQEFDTAKAHYDAARAAVDEANEKLKLLKLGPRQEEIDQGRAAFNQAQQQYDLVKLGPRVETIDQARARVEQAQANVALAQTRVEYSTVLSPLSGVVLSKNTEPGEYVAPGTPIVTVGDLHDLWLRAYVNETDLGRVKVGQPARVTTDTYPGKVYDGRVSFISSQAEFTPRSVQTTRERVKLVYRIKIDISNPNMELKPGMPADAEIQLDQAQ